MSCCSPSQVGQPQAQERAHNDKAAEAVVEALHMYNKDPAIQSAGLEALRNMAHSSTVGTKSVAASAGAIEEILATMRAHAGAADVVQHSAAALASLLVDPENQIRAGALEPDAGRLLVHALTAHRTAPAAAAEILRALSNYTWNANNRVRRSVLSRERAWAGGGPGQREVQSTPP